MRNVFKGGLLYIYCERFWGDGLGLRNSVYLVNKMKRLNFFTLVVFVLAYVFVFTGYIVYDYSLTLKKDINTDLGISVLTHANNVDTFLIGKKDRAVDFGSDGFIKNQLRDLMTGHSEDAMNRLDEHLISNKIIVDDSFYEVFALDTHGEVVGTTGYKVKRGMDFSEDSLFLNGKSNPFVKDIYDEEFARHGIVLSAPVFLDDVFVGVIVIRMTMDGVQGILKYAEDLTVGVSGQMYITDNEFKMITFSRFLSGSEQGAFVQNVASESVVRCFTNVGSWRDVSESVDFRGNDVFGVALKLEEANWCLVVEKNKDEVFWIPFKEKLFSLVMFAFISILIFGIIEYYLRWRLKE